MHLLVWCTLLAVCSAGRRPGGTYSGITAPVVKPDSTGVIPLNGEDFIPVEASSPPCPWGERPCGTFCRDRHWSRARFRHPGRVFYVRCCPKGRKNGPQLTKIDFRCPLSHFCAPLSVYGRLDTDESFEDIQERRAPKKIDGDMKQRQIVCMSKDGHPVQLNELDAATRARQTGRTKTGKAEKKSGRGGAGGSLRVTVSATAGAAIVDDEPAESAGDPSDPSSVEVAPPRSGGEADSFARVDQQEENDGTELDLPDADMFLRWLDARDEEDATASNVHGGATTSTNAAGGWQSLADPDLYVASTSAEWMLSHDDEPPWDDEGDGESLADLFNDFSGEPATRGDPSDSTAAAAAVSGFQVDLDLGQWIPKFHDGP